MCELAVTHREITTLVSMDDKHKVKVGEPSYLLAAAEWGKQVIVEPNQVMAVRDHDFSKCTLTLNFEVNLKFTLNKDFFYLCIS